MKRYERKELLPSTKNKEQGKKGRTLNDKTHNFSYLEFSPEKKKTMLRHLARRVATSVSSSAASSSTSSSSAWTRCGRSFLVRLFFLYWSCVSSFLFFLRGYRMRGEKTAKIDRLAFSGEDPPLLFVHISLSFADPFSLSRIIDR